MTSLRCIVPEDAQPEGATHYVTVTFLIRASARHNLAPKKPTTVPKAPADKPGANFRTLEFTEGWEATYLPATPQNRTPTGSSRT